MTERSGNSERLDSWKDIASYLGRNVRTVIRWEKDRGLPIHRVPGGQRHAVYAWRQEIDEWLSQGAKQVEEQSEIDVPCTGASDSIPEGPGSKNHNGFESRQTDLYPTVVRGRLNRWGYLAIAAVFLLIFGYTIRTVAFPPKFHFTGAIQLTDDGHQKQGLVSDGTNLYFSELKADRTVLAEVSVNGGAIHAIPTPFRKVVPIDISTTRRELLVTVREGDEEEGRLWIVPLAGGQPRPLGNIRCHSAAWSPDSTAIAFAFRNGIYLTPDEGASTHVLQQFDRVPKLLRWSPDGRKLRFFLKAPDDYEASLWQMSFGQDSEYEVRSLEPLHAVAQDPGSFVFGKNRSFVTSSPGGGEILMIGPRQGLWREGLSVTPIDREISGPGGLVIDSSSKRMFAIGQSGVSDEERVGSQIELLKLDPTTLQFQPFLPGISAKDVDFSRDGGLIAFVSEPGHALWIGKADGSEARRVPFSVDDMELPRWSPNGRSVAFMARSDGRPWRIFVAQLSDGRVSEASAGDDNQGAPTWSPDGRSLVYGNVRCQEASNCAIHIIDLASKHQTMIPGSEGLQTARWSPDGRFIAALSPEKHQVMIFDVKRREWHLLVDDVNGNDLAWSRDSRFLFASRSLNERPEILRISPTSGIVEKAADLTALAALFGNTELWFAVTPDQRFVLAHSMVASEIYSLPFVQN